MVEGALIKPEDIGDIQKFDDEDFSLSTKSGDWLPRLQLMTSNSEPCKGGKFPINHYAVVEGQNFADLGETVDILVIAWRPKAIEIGDEIITIHDPKHDEFKRIQAKSEEPNSGCMYGPEYLVWIPQSKQFVTYFMGSKSARRESPALRALLHNAATLKSHEVKTSKYTWYAPTVTQCSTPFDLPEAEEIKKQVEKFNNPPETQVERVEEKPEAERAR